MHTPDDPKLLRIVLLAVGILFLAGVYPLTIVWPEGWAWHHSGQSLYLQMIVAIYATLGIFLIVASREPLAHRSLIWFTVWSSVVHGGMMTAQSIVYPEHRGHLYGDVPALFIVAAVLAVLMRRGGAPAQDLTVKFLPSGVRSKAPSITERSQSAVAMAPPKE